MGLVGEGPFYLVLRPQALDLWWPRVEALLPQFPKRYEVRLRSADTTPCWLAPAWGPRQKVPGEVTRHGGPKETGNKGMIPFYADSLILGHQWNRVCRLRVSGSWARTRHRSATTSIISSRS
jgi:hypothetical protein